MPSALVDYIARQRLAANAKQNTMRTASEVFDDVYRSNSWGGPKGEIYSGSGSVGSAARDFTQMINAYIQDHDIRSVLDLGCGDHRVGQAIVCANYVGVDVSPTVVRINNEKFASSSKAFLCLDAAGPDRLPDADLCIVRQVFQHLSNAQIAIILDKLAAFPHVIVSEHYPLADDFVAHNIDIVHGPGTRLYVGSAVYLDKPPFNLRTELLLETAGTSRLGNVHEGGTIRTMRVFWP